MKPLSLTKWAAAALLLLPPFCFGQEPNRIEKSRIPSEADSVQKFVPAGWKIEEQVTGDLNSDSVPDYAVRTVFRSKGNRDVKSSSKIPVKKTSIELVDSEEFEEAATRRLGLY
jgi:hypothetical protein